ncbi:MAG: MFS transporter [Candidatus Omnitrophica bacterium]|nr:MFS transporter [Candidatus Omnitrophota bacterium]MDD5352769.1 MFS transporter [Candidatus Omnitrophota bacterium]MDD5550368.1 MFS transporter [Candidatus Omnitrophota bacterium]
MKEISGIVNYKKTAIQLIILFGLVSLFGDIVYEGARGVNGPYLKVLGANAIIVGLVAGIGEFMGYAIRLFSGYFSDKTKAYWIFTFLGYGMLISIPLLSLTGIWQIAVLFIVFERIGKALRSPAKDTILSHATQQIGTGLGFGILEAMDQIGAIAGPLIFAGLFFFSGVKDKTIVDYQHGYRFLWVPFVMVMFCLFLAYKRVPDPQHLETSLKKTEGPGKLTRIFWLYTIFSFVTTLGFANFALIGYHFKAQHILSDAQIPLFYAIAMGVDAVVALLIGKAYDIFKNRNNNDKAGLSTLIIIPLFSLFIPILAFSKSYMMAFASVILWGVVMGAHETIMRSAIADLTPLNKRGTGYGIFNTSYGFAILIGSSLMGLLYEKSLNLLVIGAVAVEILAIPIFFAMRKESLALKSK